MSDQSSSTAKITFSTNIPGLLVKELSKQFQDASKTISNAFSSSFSINAAVNAIIASTEQALAEIKKADSYLAEISKENENLSKRQLTEMGNLAFETASKYGQSATEYLAQVQKLLQAGYRNAEKLAELSLAAQTAGSMTSDLANKYLLAADQAYGLQGNVTKLTQALDGADAIASRHTVTMAELTQGISAVSSTAADSKISIAETTAAVGTLISVTHEGGAKMGEAFQGILMLLQQITGTVGSSSKAIDASSLEQYKKACEDLGVSMTTVKKGAAFLKEPLALLQELSIAYTALDESDSKRMSLLNATGDSARADALNALLENYGLYEQMLKEYAAGQGSIAANVEKTADSWEGSLNRLSHTWTDTISNLIDSGVLPGIINNLNSILTFINKITAGLGPLNSLSATIGTVLGLKNIGTSQMHEVFSICRSYKCSVRYDSFLIYLAKYAKKTKGQYAGKLLHCMALSF